MPLSDDRCELQQPALSLVEGHFCVNRYPLTPKALQNQGQSAQKDSSRGVGLLPSVLPSACTRGGQPDHSALLSCEDVPRWTAVHLGVRGFRDERAVTVENPRLDPPPETTDQRSEVLNPVAIRVGELGYRNRGGRPR